MASSQSWDLFHIVLLTAFLQGQSYCVNHDVLCQLPPVAGHPPETDARLKKHACGKSDAPRRVWICVVLTRASQIGTERALDEGMAQMTSHLHRVCDHREMQQDRNCEVCLRTKKDKAPCRRRNSEAARQAEKFGDSITADHKVLHEEGESRNNHRYAVVVQDLATQWIQSYPCRTKNSTN